ncbi:MAG: hypothetical protein JW726_04160 [Anaerolineales bacterium]|nr:hypothetical protein [Anaerolineales bacterium]
MESQHEHMAVREVDGVKFRRVSWSRYDPRTECEQTRDRYQMLDGDHVVENKRPALPFILALGVTLLMGLAYTLLDILQVPEPGQSLLAFIPGLVSLVALASGSGLCASLGHCPGADLPRCPFA